MKPKQGTEPVRMVYVGALEELAGKTALVAEADHGHPTMVVAQFDDKSAEFMTEKLGIGWHAFLRTSFRGIPVVIDDEPQEEVDDAEVDLEADDPDCPMCAGTGEGQFGESACSTCHGRGY